MTYENIVSTRTGATTRIDLEEANQADTSAFAKRVILVDSSGNTLGGGESNLSYKQIMENSNGAPIYIGLAVPGTATSDPLWQIRKITYDSLNAPTNIDFASGNTNFDKVWDNRASYSYS